MNIGEKIKRLRTQKMMTQSELAGDQITRNMLSLLEKGKAVPSVQTLVYLAERLGVSAGYLLADEQEEGLFLKSDKLFEIRLAYEQKRYGICLDLCQSLERAGGKDAELSLIMAECSLEQAKEELYYDNVRGACARFDDAVQYAFETMYPTDTIKATVWLYFEYLGEISPSIGSENLDMRAFDAESAKCLSFGDPFCRYLTALRLADAGESVERYLAFAYEKTPMLAKHVSARVHMRAGDFQLASGELGEILRADEWVAGVVLYHVFEDLESCCRQLGNQKAARQYAEARVEQFEKLMS